MPWPQKQKGQPQGEVDPASKLDFRVVRVAEVADHPDADGLFVLQLDAGPELEARQVCAGLKHSYTADELLNRRVVLFANLKPAKLRGIESRGMLLAADLPDNKAALIDPGEIEVGTALQFGDVPLAPKSKASIKDFDKLKLSVQSGGVAYGSHRLHAADSPDLEIKSDAPERASVH